MSEKDLFYDKSDFFHSCREAFLDKFVSTAINQAIEIGFFVQPPRARVCVECEVALAT